MNRLERIAARAKAEKAIVAPRVIKKEVDRMSDQEAGESFFRGDRIWR